MYDRCHRLGEVIIDASWSRFGICENLTIYENYGIIFIENEERENPYKASSSSRGKVMAKTFNYWRELHKARLEAEFTFRTRQIELLKEQILSGDEDPSWVHNLVETMKCADRIGRKLDEMADEDSMELEEEEDNVEEEEEQTIFNPELEYDLEQLGELVYDPFKNIYTNEKGQIFRERADGCFVLIKKEVEDHD